ncbi:MAG: mechanosensitive ion channel family protein [Anaerovoracaceae bacterium]|nr:mechanosensitive ion channel family protein [Anaerovoracaceae bacterium]
MIDFSRLKEMDMLYTVLGAAAIVVVGLILIKIIAGLAKKALLRTGLDESMHKFIINVLKIVLYIIMIVVLLGHLKVPTAPLVTVLGAAGAAIALALKDSLGNIAGGVLILANKPFKKGDVIDVAGTEGMVDSIDLFVTTLKTFDNKVVTVPNGTVTTSVIVNYSRENMRRVDCVFDVSYDSDITAAKDVLLAVADRCPDAYKEPAPVVGVSEHRGSSVALDLKVWCETSKYYDVQYYLEEEVKAAFEKANITIPYPRMDLRVRK